MEASTTRKLDTTTTSMNVVDLNNLVVSMRKLVKKAKVHIIRKLTLQIKKYRARKGEEINKDVFNKKADRLVDEINVIKKLETDRVAKHCLANTKNVSDIANSEKLEEKSLTRLACQKDLKAKVTKWREEHDDWSSLAAFLLSKNTGRRFKKKKNKSKTDNTLTRGNTTVVDTTDKPKKDTESTPLEKVAENTVPKVSDLDSDTSEEDKNESVQFEKMSEGSTDSAEITNLSVVKSGKSESVKDTMTKVEPWVSTVQKAATAVKVSRVNMDATDELDSDTSHEDTDESGQIKIVAEDLIGPVEITKLSAVKTGSRDIEKDMTDVEPTVSTVQKKVIKKRYNKEMVVAKLNLGSVNEGEHTLHLPSQSDIVESEEDEDMSTSRPLIAQTSGSESVSLTTTGECSDPGNSGARKKDAFFMTSDTESESGDEDGAQQHVQMEAITEDDAGDKVSANTRKRFETTFLGSLSSRPRFNDTGRYQKQPWQRDIPNRPWNKPKQPFVHDRQQRNNPHFSQPYSKFDAQRPSRQNTNFGSYTQRPQSRIEQPSVPSVTTKEKVHPSWEASRKRKLQQQAGLTAFQGKRIQFNDDD